ncbi:MAG: stage V sporulation protein AD [Clostridia bacterium]|nr:stage V sporulation protein AD [Clostridia bacterium]
MAYYKHRTISFDNCYVKDGFTIAGPKESDGCLRGHFDVQLKDDMMGEDTFEHAERKMFETAIEGIAAKSNLCFDEVNLVLGGDLLNQTVSTSFAMRKHPVAFLGLYNACATFVEGLIIGSTMVQSYLKNVICLAGSHFSTAERQYRYPLELGVLRSPVTQWTATGVGSCMLTNDCTQSNVKIVRATIGRVVDYGIMDVNNMGAAMAPAAKDTLIAHFRATDTHPSDYDLILTGDLGKLGKQILVELMAKEGYDLSNNCADCGASLYFEEQQTYQGGSGAACSALVFSGIVLSNLKKGKIKRMLLVGTGALMSPTTSFQGDSIPAIAHLVEICSTQEVCDDIS